MINKISNKIFGFSEMIKQHILIKCVIKGFASYYCMLYFFKKKGATSILPSRARVSVE